MNINIDIIVKVIIPILGAILTYLIWPLIDQKTTKEQRENIMSLVRIAVAAAEQMKDAGLIEIPKKSYVVDYINKKGERVGDVPNALLYEQKFPNIKLNVYTTGGGYNLYNSKTEKTYNGGTLQEVIININK